jgi:hypothetical protein
MFFTTKAGTTRGRRIRLAGSSLLGLIAVTAFSATQVRADDKKVDSWCAVIEKQIERNRDESNKAHDSNGTERLREERRRLDNDAHQRHCPGH